MEDEVLIEEKFVVDGCELKGFLSLYCVFDGHGGKDAATFAKNNLLSCLTEKLKSVMISLNHGPVLFCHALDGWWWWSYCVLHSSVPESCPSPQVRLPQNWYTNATAGA